MQTTERDKKAFSDGAQTHTRQLEESLGAPAGGCKCQSRWVVLVEGGKAIESEQQTETPSHLRKREKMWFDKFLVEKEARFFIDWDKADETDSAGNLSAVYGRPYIEDEDGKLREIGGLEEIAFHTVDGEPRFEDDCNAFHDQMDFEYALADNFEKLPDGIYLLLAESACWTSYDSHYGIHEGDSETVLKIYPSVPLEHKDFFASQ